MLITKTGWIRTLQFESYVLKTFVRKLLATHDLNSKQIEYNPDYEAYCIITLKWPKCCIVPFTPKMPIFQESPEILPLHAVKASA